MKRIPPFVACVFVFAMCVVTSDSVSGQWKPAETRLITEWGRALKPDAVWQEYPRPQMERSNWTNLNGLWSYAITTKDSAKPTKWDGQLLVPFAPEAPLSGVGRLVEPIEALWYRRSFTTPKTNGQQTLLNFEAVDYDATVWVNGKEVGSHRGGHTPFTFDITDALVNGENELVVRVLDATEGYQLHGKQKLRNEGIWYTRVTGIWQTVWMEQVPTVHLRDLNYACDIDKGTITVTPEFSKSSEGAKIRVTASFKGQEVGKGECAGPVTIAINKAQLWSPDAPNLYDLKVDLLNASGTVIDSVKAYTALRKFDKAKNEQGHWQLTLNNQPIFQWGPLDQGWWPDGLLTPPSDTAMRSDIEFLKACGFNMIRKHIKVEPRRYYHHCDRAWHDHVAGSS